MISFRLYTLFTFLLVLIGSGTRAQVIINEISYNPPESGNDSLEYIELYNAGGAAVNLSGWHFTGGVADTLPDADLQPGEYFVTAINAQAMSNVFGISVHQWSSGALNNTGEVIILVDAAANVIDSVRYADSDPWPVEADGMGPSLELRDPLLDNDLGENWQISGGATGIIINGKEVSGTPGAENSGGGSGGPFVTITAANLKFNPKHAVVKIGDLVRWVNPETLIPHNVNGTQATYPNNPADIYSGPPTEGVWEYDITPAIAGLYDYQCDLHVSQGMVGTLSVYNPLTYTDFPLPHLRLTDGTNGQHIFDGVPTTVTGIVHGLNYQPTGYSFYIINPDNVGINVFSPNPGSYTVTEGDLVKVSGVIDQFNGLLEIRPDAIEVLATNQSLVPPASINVPTEEYESSHVTLAPFSVDSIITTGTSGFNVFGHNGFGNPVLVRIDIDSGLDTNAIGGGNGNGIIVTGIGTQFDSSLPFTSGYQILALQFGIMPGFPILSRDAITMTPNPVSDQLTFRGEVLMEEINLVSVDGRSVIHRSLHTTEGHLQVSDVAPGMYIVKINTPEGLWASKVWITE